MVHLLQQQKQTQFPKSIQIPTQKEKVEVFSFKKTA